MNRVEVAIVGAGFAGLGMAIALRRAGREDFVVLERAASVGGTWRDNTYPGVACDVPSHLYGFADHPNPHWSGTFARGDEIRRYLEEVAERESLGDRLRLHAPVLSAEWDAAASVWRIETGGDSPATIEAEVLVLACGRLTEPAIPEISGLETFPGPLFHSSRWDHDAELAGARVALVGTGASAVQVLPELARVAAHVTLFQRTPAWIVPRGGGVYTDEDRRRFDEHPDELARLRAELYTEGEARFASRSGDAAAASAAREIALTICTAQVSSPGLRAALTPGYAFGCKRVLLSDDFYPAVSSEKVTLEASALASVDGRMLTAVGGAVFEADALVLATGFASTRQPYAELVSGEGGVTLAQHWSMGMTSFGSTVVSGFPNMFVLNGPNASLGHNSSVLMIEEQAAYAVRALAGRDGFADGVLRVAPAAEVQYTDEIAAAAATHAVDRRRLPQLVRRRAIRPADAPVAGHRRGVPRAARPSGRLGVPVRDPGIRCRARRGRHDPRGARRRTTHREGSIMTFPLRFGYKASAEQFGPNELCEFAVLAEEMGFDSVFVSDHLQPWLHEGGHAPASIPWLGALGARTSRIVFGTSVLTPTFRYNPTVIAQDFATLGVMYPGRVILGVGTGEALNEANLGIAWPDPPERFQRLKEAIGLIQRLWSEERVNFDGTYYNDPQRHDLRQARRAGADLHRRRGPRRDPPRRPHRRWFHHDIGQVAEPVHRHAAACPARGSREGRSRRRRDRHAHGGEGLVPPRPRHRSREDAVLGAARAQPRREDGHRRPARDAATRRAAADRARRIAVHRLERPR